MKKQKQINEMNELCDLLSDIGADWDAYIDECQENEQEPQISYYDFHAQSIIEQGYRKQSEVIKDFINQFEKYIGNCTFTLGQFNDIQYALKKATEDVTGE